MLRGESAEQSEQKGCRRREPGKGAQLGFEETKTNESPHVIYEQNSSVEISVVIS